MRKRIITLLLLSSAFACKNNTPSIETTDFVLSFNDHLQTMILSKFENAYPVFNNFQTSEYIKTDNGDIKDFLISESNYHDFSNDFGQGKSLHISGNYQKNDVSIVKDITVRVFAAFPGMAVFDVKYINTGIQPVRIEKWVNHDYVLAGNQDSIPFWSFQSGSYESRPDWVLPLRSGFHQVNYMGMNASDYGGGTPVSDVWRKDLGIAIGHLEKVPKLVSLPVESENVHQGAHISLEYKKATIFQPGDSLKTFTTFVMLHKGDYFKALSEYSRFMSGQGLIMAKVPETSYEPIWCAWGYERNFTTAQVLNTLPKVAQMGYKWAVLDDGWQTAEGDWFLNPKKFPHGDSDMRKFTQSIKDNGLKPKLWWAALAVDPGTKLITEHPDMLLINKEGKKQLISWWDSYYLCPAYKGTIEYTKALIKKFMQDWGFDGLKIDGQHLNAVPPCYNPAHHHAYPEESVEKLHDFWKMVYKTAKSINPDAVVEICPCGTACTFFNMPYMNQSVASDPTSSWQIRLKGKTYKALMGASAPYYGDHVELSDSSSDFASTVGIGGVIGTKFTWPVGVHMNTESGDVSLTKEREAQWRKWLDIYQKYELPKGQYLGTLYDIGFDRPETHVIKKGQDLYYAFYAKQYSGQLELRGLENGTYELVNYVSGDNLGQVASGTSHFDTSFRDYLLLKASPVTSD